MIGRLRRYPAPVIRDKVARRVRVAFHAVTAGVFDRVGHTIALPSADVRAHRSAFHLDPARRTATIDTLDRHWPAERARIVERADGVLAGQVEIHGCRVPLPVLAADWHRDRVSGYLWPPEPSREIDYVSADPGSDVRSIWELARQQWLVTLGQAYWLTDDRRYAVAIVDTVTHWIASNPPGRGVHWTVPMEAALRLVSWGWAYYFLLGAYTIDEEVHRRWLHSAAEHARFIRENLEYTPLSGNHLIADGLGLMYAGAAFPTLPGATEDRRRGFAIVTRAVLDQTYEDGLDYEGSSAYHRFVGDMAIDALLLARLGGLAPPTAFVERVRAMVHVSEAITFPDGRGPEFGDDDDGHVWRFTDRSGDDHRPFVATAAIALDVARPRHEALPVEALWLCGPGAIELWQRCDDAPPPRSRAFAHSGIYVMRRGETHVVIDAGPPGMGDGGHGGHGHVDALSLTVAVGGRRFLVDAGTYRYTGDHGWRNALRGEASHNTIRVDRQDSIGQIGPWQLGEAPRPFVRAWMSAQGRDTFVGERIGPCADGSFFRHRRRVYLAENGCLLIVDDVLGTGRHTVERFFHLPESDVRIQGRRLTVGGADLLVLSAETSESLVSGDEASRIGWRSPAYGVIAPGATLVESYSGPLPVRMVAIVSADPHFDARLAADCSVIVERPTRIDTIPLPPLADSA